jgi:hypothetical protein
MCKDPVTQELNKRGYNLVKLPRVGIEPLDVLGRDGDSMEKLGSVTEVWTSSVAAPIAGAPAPAAGIGGQKTSDLDVAIGLKLLSNVLSGLGGGISLPSLNAAFKRSRKVQFEFVNVESTSVTPFALGKFLANGTLDTSNPFVSHYFGNDETQEYIIFDVLKSDTITVTSKSESGVSVDADIGALSGALSANVKVTAGSAGNSELTFKSAVKATFAFKLFEVFFENGKWVPKGAAADDDLSFAAPVVAGVAAETSVVIKPGRMLKIAM